MLALYDRKLTSTLASSFFLKSYSCVVVFRYMRYNHTDQCKRTGGCYNELVVAFFSTGGGVKGKKSIPVDFMIYL